GSARTRTGALTLSLTDALPISANAITLTTGTNDFGGAVTATGSNIALTDTNALSAAITASGSGALVAGTNLTLSGSTGTTLTTTSRAGTASIGGTRGGLTLSTA